jgi:hypothetical protein
MGLLSATGGAIHWTTVRRGPAGLTALRVQHAAAAPGTI